MILHKANCTTYNFACRAKQDEYNVRYASFSCITILKENTGLDPHEVWNLVYKFLELQRRSNGATGFASLSLGALNQGMRFSSLTLPPLYTTSIIYVFSGSNINLLSVNLEYFGTGITTLDLLWRRITLQVVCGCWNFLCDFLLWTRLARQKPFCVARV